MVHLPVAASTWRLAGLLVPPGVYMCLFTVETATGETTYSNLPLYCFQAKSVAGYVDMWMVTLRFYVGSTPPEKASELGKSSEYGDGGDAVPGRGRGGGGAAAQRGPRAAANTNLEGSIPRHSYTWGAITLGTEFRYRLLYNKHIYLHPSRYVFPAPVHSRLLLYGALPSVSQTLHSRISL